MLVGSQVCFLVLLIESLCVSIVFVFNLVFDSKIIV